ncbi:MAG: hypothetical protein A2X22_09975 [Bacteroidetes bacterium GWF2_49_14]|nr:MAG: hypothetical protein A2X22_09975 [Bacteroidetes bacterium GWF2_49_14]
MAGAASGGVLLNAFTAGAMDTNKIVDDNILNNSVSPNVIYASRAGLKLDSNVHTGGGTDETNEIQSILDKALETGNLHFIMDGAALIRGINIHSNTTIECLNSSCGFFLAAQSNRSVIQNANLNKTGERRDKNITLQGGTYNQNCKNQVHHLTEQGKEIWVIGMEFYGVENLTVRDVTIRDQRTFAMLVANWYRVNMENISIELPGYMQAENQDGIHFWGPGQYLTMRNIQGTSGDDFIALAPDENDSVSSITDVLIDGVFLNNADQGIRLLSRDDGRLDRVIIKNVTGTYRSFGFYINPFFEGKGGNFGSIVFDTINLQHSKPNYTYTTPFLFRLGGRIESLILKNIIHHNPSDARSILDVGWPNSEPKNTCIKSLVVDGLHVYETDNKASNASYIKIMAEVGNMVVRDVEIVRSSESEQKGCLIETFNTGKINTLFMNSIYANRINSLLLNNGSEIETVQLNNILGSEIGGSLIHVENGNINRINAGNVFGADLLKLGNGGTVGKVYGESVL